MLDPVQRRGMWPTLPPGHSWPGLSNPLPAEVPASTWPAGVGGSRRGSARTIPASLSAASPLQLDPPAQLMRKPLPGPRGEMPGITEHSKGTASSDCQPPPSNQPEGAGRTC